MAAPAAGGEDGGMLVRNYDGCTALLVARETGHGLAPMSVTCVFDGLPLRWKALVDTAAQWSIMPPDAAQQLGIQIPPGPTVPLSTRFGTLEGVFVEHRVHLPPRAGKALDIESRWWVSEEWRWGPVIGWCGFLERIRFGCDPGAQPEDEPEFLYALL